MRLLGVLGSSNNLKAPSRFSIFRGGDVSGDSDKGEHDKQGDDALSGVANLGSQLKDESIGESSNSDIVIEIDSDFKCRLSAGLRLGRGDDSSSKFNRTAIGRCGKRFLRPSSDMLLEINARILVKSLSMRRTLCRGEFKELTNQREPHPATSCRQNLPVIN